MPKVHRNRPPTNNLTGLGVTRAHTAPIGAAPVFIVKDDTAAADDAAVVERPAKSATKAVWLEYAELVFGGSFDHLTKAELVELVEETDG